MKLLSRNEHTPDAIYQNKVLLSNKTVSACPDCKIYITIIIGVDIKRDLGSRSTKMPGKMSSLWLVLLYDMNVNKRGQEPSAPWEGPQLNQP